MRSFSDLAPQPLWNYFSEILKVPRPSKKEEKIIAWLLEFAAVHGLEAKRDDAGNVLISKPAVPGREKAPVVVLQTHMDMVCEKNNDVSHDFSKDPIPLTIEGDKLTAKGTTLGADTGIGVAITLAILKDKDAHP